MPEQQKPCTSMNDSRLTREAFMPHAESTRAEESALGPSTLQPQPPQRTLTVLEAREHMRNAVEPEAHRIAGVTFEGRQEAVQKLQAGGTIILCLSSAGTGSALCCHAASLPHCNYWQETKQAAISLSD